MKTQKRSVQDLLGLVDNEGLDFFTEFHFDANEYDIPAWAVRRFEEVVHPYKEAKSELEAVLEALEEEVGYDEGEDADE